MEYPKKSYSNYEYKNMGSHNPIAQKIIASGILGSTNAEEIKKQFREEKRRERNKHRIPNIPNFYERLNSLCDKDGKINVDSNHPMLQDLREAVGGERYMEKKAYDN